MEQWKYIEGYEGEYQVSSLGRVKSLKYGRENIMKLSKNNVYSKIGLSNNGIMYYYNIHRLVGVYFIPNPDNLPLVCHKIEDLDEKGLLYNGFDNLYWGTVKDNSQDMLRKGRDKNHFISNHPNRGKLGKDHPNSKKVNQYSLEGEFIKEWGSIVDIKRELLLNISSLSACCNGKQKTAGGFIFKFK